VDVEFIFGAGKANIIRRLDIRLPCASESVESVAAFTEAEEFPELNNSIFQI